jgi:hypothetical protein
LWKGVLLNQFHDILPGSSIHRVYEEAEALHRQVIRDAERLRKQAYRAKRKQAEAERKCPGTVPDRSQTVPSPVPRDSTESSGTEAESTGGPENPAESGARLNTEGFGPGRVPDKSRDVPPLELELDKEIRVKKDERHAYGSEKNVLLTDKQMASLVKDLGEPMTRACIEELSTAKAMKGYVYKRDDLAIRKWVVESVTKRTGAPAPSRPSPTCPNCGSTNLGPAGCRTCRYDMAMPVADWRDQFGEPAV